MRQNLIFIALSLAWCFLLNGQSLGQDTENFSTIVFPSINVSLNLSESSANFSLYRDLRIKNEEPQNLTPISNVFTSSGLSVTQYMALLEANIKANNKKRNKNKNSKYITLGLDFKGTAENGVAPIFSSDKIASSASFSSLLGYKWTQFSYRDEYLKDYVEARIKLKKEAEIKSKINELLKNKVINSPNKAFLTQFSGIEDISQRIENVDKVISEIPLLIASVPVTPNLNAEVNHLKSLKNIVKKISNLINVDPLDTDDIYVQIGNLQVLVNDSNYKALNKSLGFNNANLYKTNWGSVLLKIKTRYLQKLDRLTKINNSVTVPNLYDGVTELNNLLILFTQYRVGLVKLQSLDLNNLDELLNKIKHKHRYLIYFRGGVTGSKFRYDLENNGTTVDTRFKNVTFNGYNLDIGATLQIHELNFFGLSFGLNYTHNLSQLNDKTFALQVVDPNIMNGNFTSVTEVKAISGDYDRFHRIDFNFDYARLFRLKETQESNKTSYLLLSLNPYFRHRIYENAFVLDNNTVLGLGIHAYNSKDNKIMGGVYVQTPDLFRVHKNDEDLFDEGFNFGLIIKYNFQGLKTK